MRKWMLFMITLLLSAAITACGSGRNNESDTQPMGESASVTTGGKSNITILIGKPEIAKQFEQMAGEYSKMYKTNITLIPLGGQTAYEKLATLYASGNAPTIMMLGSELPSMKGKLLDLSNQPWVKHALPGTLDYAKDGDKVYGMPVNVEAFGMMYNKAVLDKAAGGSFDPSSIKTRDDLKKLFDQITASGESAFHFSPMDWSLGAHFTNMMFGTQSDDRSQRHQFLADLKAGKVKLADNPVFNGWLDTFDMLKEYNQFKKAPLAPVYDDGTLALANGKAGFWFMGNWAYPQLKEINPQGQYGFLPVPISDNAGDYGNTQISAGVPSYWTIDATKSTPQQQKAAKDFLNWMVSDPQGQDYYVNEFSFIPAYDNFTVKPDDLLSRTVMEYLASGKTLEAVGSYFPADGWPNMGATLQKYLFGIIDRAEVAKEFEAYWKNAK
ncbi:ABC transporter substrate-binding protein [Paenibacillus beijingensis]|uniref:ABC transporter substrate-binding protein n=1 Tax=Paenibacillus beijingensis TaxID=1126833 RepID=A0A0D5NKR2_9BACL|nr:ABC transporter substrate-binding protein [Paenibacillus beijingensis]AJY75939.1 ABC transporter substrate-binding protein [Paenibacillus beijingensis]